MFLPFQKINKITFLLLIFFVVFFSSLFLNTKKAEAIVPVEDVVTQGILADIALTISDMAIQQAGTIGGTTLDLTSAATVGKLFIKRLLRQLTQSIVNWIDSGFEGNPAFITNTGKFLQDTADIAIGDMLLGTDLEFLCDPFKLQIKLALGLQYRPFKEDIRCSFTGVLGNVNNAMNKFTNGDFIGGGGWDSWMRMTTQPQNNQIGAMMLAQAELDARIQTSKGNATLEANWGGGFMSWKDCPDRITTVNNTTITSAIASDNRIDHYAEVTGQKRGDDGCVIKTPGGVIVDKLGWANSSDIRELELAQDLDAIFNALVNQAITAGMNFLTATTHSNSSQPTQAQLNVSYLNALQTQLENQQKSGGSSGASSVIRNPSNVSSVSNNSNTNNQNIAQTPTSRNSAIDTINSLIAIENQFINTQNEIARLLNTTQNIFALSTCSAIIKDTVSTQISGDYTGVKDLVWNKKDIAQATTTTVTNISILNVTKDAVNSYPDNSIIQEQLQNVNSLSTLHTTVDVASFSAGGTAYNQVRDWVVSKVNNNKSVCNINTGGLTEWGDSIVSSVLSIFKVK